MSVETELWRHAKEISEYAQARVSQLEGDVFDLENRLAKAKAERDTARLAPKRLINYRPSLGPDNQCPSCWVEHERRSPLRAVPSNTGDVDIFRCDSCGRDFDIHFR